MSAQENAGLRDSLSAATELLAYHPDSIDLRLKKVRWNIQLKQWQYAKDDLDKVLFLDNRNIAGLFYRAYINQQLMRYNFARLDYNNLLTIVPGNFEAQLGLALLNQKDKHYTEAYDQINVLVEAHPDSATAYAARAGIENDRGMLELAEYDYGKAFELDRKNIDYLINRADIRISLCRMSEARRDLDLATKLGYPRPALTEFYRRLRKK
jgi:Flp pilus assembly protein TadD